MRIRLALALLLLTTTSVYGLQPWWVSTADRPFLDDTLGLTMLKLSFYSVAVRSGSEQRTLIVDKTFTLDGAGKVLALDL